MPYKHENKDHLPAHPQKDYPNTAYVAIAASKSFFTASFVNQANATPTTDTYSHVIILSPLSLGQLTGRDRKTKVLRRGRASVVSHGVVKAEGEIHHI